MNRRKNDRHRIRNIVVSSSNDDDDSFTIYLFIVMCLSSRKWKRKTKKNRETLDYFPIEFEYGDFQGPFEPR